MAQEFDLVPLTAEEEAQVFELVPLSEDEEIIPLGEATQSAPPANSETAEAVATPPAPPEEPGFLERAGREVLGVGENILSSVTGFGADVSGGLAGGLRSGLDTLTELTRGATIDEATTKGFQAGEETQRSIQNALTFQPRTEEGQRNIRKIGEVVNDVVELDKEDPIPIVHQLRQVFGQEDNAVGNFMAKVARQTGSPTLEAFAGAFGSTLGPGALEVLGFKGAGNLARGTGLKAKIASDAGAIADLQKAMPTPKKYLQAAKGVFKETDKAGATVLPEAMPKLARQIREGLSEGGYRPDVNPLPPIEKMLLKLDEGIPISTADMRELGKAMSKMGEQGSHQQALGIGIAADMDDFMARSGVLKLPPGTSPKIAESYRIARKMYGQGKRSQTMKNMIEFAGSEGKDFIQTMNTQLNALIKNQIFKKGEGRFFSKADRKIMENMIADSRGEKFLQNMSKLSPFRSNAGGLVSILSTIGGTGAGVGSGSITLGGLVAATPFALGEGARIWGEAIFKGKAKLGNALLQAGNRGKRIAKAYFENTPKKQRNPEDLGRLLSDPNIDIADIPKTKFTVEAMKIADQRRKDILNAGVLATTETLVTEEQE